MEHTKVPKYFLYSVNNKLKVQFPITYAAETWRLKARTAAKLNST
jgi:hypothetical protein